MIILDYRDKRPLYEQVVEKLSHLIVAGALEADTKMPSVRALAMDLSINPNTIQRAYSILEQQGYIYSITGRGNYVAPADGWQNGVLTAAKEDLSKAICAAKLAGISQADATELVHKLYQTDKEGNLS